MSSPRTALVTGASQGIGRRIAQRQAEAGYAVMLAARGDDGLEQAASEIHRDTGADVRWTSTDMGDPAAIQRLVDGTLESFGRIDLLVNSAGGAPYGYLLDLSEEDWGLAFEVKFLGAVRASRAVLPAMIEQGGGSIVCIAGTGGVEVLPEHMAGGAANVALVHFVKALAIQYGPEGVRANCVSPGPTRTQRWAYTVESNAARSGISPEAWEEGATAAIPLRRIAEPSDVASVVAFLASDEAAFVSGTHVRVDGGATTAL